MSSEFRVGRPSPDEETRIAEVGPAPQTGIAVIRAIYRDTSAPSSAGENWNALFDILSDTAWAGGHSIAICHETSLASLPPDDRANYLEVLRDAADRNPLGLQVWFREPPEMPNRK